MTRVLKVSLLLLLPLCVNAQFSKIKTIETSEDISFASIDRPGDLYLLSSEGQIQKFSEEGILRAVHKTNPPPTLFDPRDGARLFAFYRPDRTYAFLTPSFEFSTAYEIDSAFAINPWLACPSGETSLWCIDASDGSLKKINTETGIIDVDSKLDISDISNISAMREYQGFVFILVKGMGVNIYNNLGKLIRSIADKTISSFNFLGEELYYNTGENLIMFDLFSAETRTVKLPSPSTFAILSDTHLFLITGKKADIYSYKSE